MSRSRLAALYALAVILGIVSAWLWLTKVGPSGVDAGVWRVNLLAGSTSADAYTRARIALGALLALDRRETLYYIARSDERGESLRADCRYRLSGPAPAARSAGSDRLRRGSGERYGEATGSAHARRGSFAVDPAPLQPCALAAT